LSVNFHQHNEHRIYIDKFKVSLSPDDWGGRWWYCCSTK